MVDAASDSAVARGAAQRVAYVAEAMDHNSDEDDLISSKSEAGDNILEDLMYIGVLINVLCYLTPADMANTAYAYSDIWNQVRKTIHDDYWGYGIINLG